MNKSKLYKLYIEKFFLYIVLIILILYGVRCSKGNDFLSYYDVGLNFRALIDNIYIPGKYSGMQNHYPPFFAMIMVPFTLIPPLIAGYVFYLLKIVLIFITIKILPEFFTERKIKPIILFLSFIIIFRFINDDFKLGQVNVIITTFLILSIYYKMKQKIFISALLLSAATTIKIFPCLFLFFYFLKKDYKYVGYNVIILLILNVLPAIFYLDRYPALLKYFFEESILNASQSPNSGIANQSIYAMLMRFLGNNSTDSQPLLYVNFLSMKFDSIKILYYLIFLAMMILVVWVSIYDKSKKYYAHAIIFIVALILPMVTRKSNFVFIFFPALVLFHNILNEKKYFTIESIFIWASFILLGFTADGIVGRKISNVLESFSVLTFGSLFLLFACLIKFINENKYLK